MIKWRSVKSTGASLLAMLLLLTGLGSTVEAAESGNRQKHETVYAYLDHDGTVLKQSVVNRINYSGTNRIEDYGHYTSIKALSHNLLPSISGSRVIWDVPAYQPGVLFYEGVTDHELPVKVSIEYFLNGHPVKGEELAGRDGKLLIKIRLENRLREIKTIEYKDSSGKKAHKLEEIYVPLMVQATIPVDLGRFQYIDSGDDAIKVVSGDTMTVSFGVFPYPDQELTLELVGRDMELEPATFAVIPMMPPLPEVEIEDDIDELYTGVKGLNKAVSELEKMKGSLGDVTRLVDGVGELNRGGRRLVENSDDLLDGMWKFVFGLAEISSAAGALSDGLFELAAGCSELDHGVSELSDRAWELAQGAQEIAGGGRQLTAGLGEMLEILQQLSENEILRPLLEEYGLLGLLDRISELAGGVEQFQEGLDTLAAGSQDFARGIDRQLLPGINQIARGSNKLSAGAREIHNGTEQLTGAGRELYGGTAEYLRGVNKLSGGLEQLSDGMLEMDREVGRLKNINLMDKEGKSLNEIEDSLQESLDELRLGKSTAEEMEVLAEQYVSFMDNQHNRDSSVQFIMKTRAVEKKAVPASTGENMEKPRKNFWQKLKELFVFG